VEGRSERCRPRYLISNSILKFRFSLVLPTVATASCWLCELYGLLTVSTQQAAKPVLLGPISNLQLIVQSLWSSQFVDHAANPLHVDGQHFFLLGEDTEAKDTS